MTRNPPTQATLLLPSPTDLPNQKSEPARELGDATSCSVPPDAWRVPRARAAPPLPADISLSNARSVADDLRVLNPGFITRIIACSLTCGYAALPRRPAIRGFKNQGNVCEASRRTANGDMTLRAGLYGDNPSHPQCRPVLKRHMPRWNRALVNNECFPEMYPLNREFRLNWFGNRETIFMSYSLLFDFKGDTSFVVRIFHSRQDYACLI